ncbi:unnamed protein product, partial [Vitis vinifera]|uniref:Uncharacterized protein n=1 Tax=Vitis vinifera TaxID=29760 RepID=D7TKM2_VITVI
MYVKKRKISLTKFSTTTILSSLFKSLVTPSFIYHSSTTNLPFVFSILFYVSQLLLREQAISSDRSEQGLANHFRSAMKQNRLFEILDNQVVNEGQKEEIFAVAKLAKRCLKLNGKKRPTMKQIDIDLQQLGTFQEQLSFQKTWIQEPSLQQQTCQDYCTFRLNNGMFIYAIDFWNNDVMNDSEPCFTLFNLFQVWYTYY